MSTTFVVTLGSGNIKIGIAGEDAPREVMLPVRGIKRDGNETNFMKAHNVWGYGMADPRVSKNYVAEDVMVRPEGVGTINSYEGVAAIISTYVAGADHVEDAKKEVAGDRIVLSTDTIAGNRSQLANLAEILFESVGFNAVYGNDDATFALFANGMVGGTVLDIGHGGARVTPVNDSNFVIRSDDIAQRSPIGGSTQSMVLADLLPKDPVFTGMGLTLDAAANWDLIKDPNYLNPKQLMDMKRAIAFCGDTVDETYSLPDDRDIVISKSIRSAVGEVLFNPSTFTPSSAPACSKDLPRLSPIGLLSQYHQAVSKASVEMKKDLSYLLGGPVVVVGGATLTKNFQSRFEAEVAASTDLRNAFKAGFTFTDDRQYSSFIGASIMGSMDAMDGLVATRQAYEEYGRNVTMSWGYPAPEKL